MLNTLKFYDFLIINYIFLQTKLVSLDSPLFVLIEFNRKLKISNIVCSVLIKKFTFEIGFLISLNTFNVFIGKLAAERRKL